MIVNTFSMADLKGKKKEQSNTKTCSLLSNHLTHILYTHIHHIFLCYLKQLSTIPPPQLQCKAQANGGSKLGTQQSKYYDD